MAFSKLNNDDKARRDELVTELRDKWESVETTATNLRGEIDELNAAIVAYNDTVAEVNQWREEIAERIQEAFDGKSEKWQEGEVGQAYDQWKSEWDQFEAEEVSEVEIDLPDDPTAADDLEGLPESPE